jgi:hypothetical protein
MYNKNTARDRDYTKVFNLHFHDTQESSLVKAIIKTRNCYIPLDLRYATVAYLSDKGTTRTWAMKHYVTVTSCTRRFCSGPSKVTALHSSIHNLMAFDLLFPTEYLRGGSITTAGTSRQIRC